MYLNKHLEGAGLKASTNQLPPTTKKHSVPAADSFWNTWLLFHLALHINPHIIFAWTSWASPRSFVSLWTCGHRPPELFGCRDSAWSRSPTPRKRTPCRSTRRIRCYFRWFSRKSWMTYPRLWTFWTRLAQSWRFLSWPSWRTFFSSRNQQCSLWPSCASGSFTYYRPSAFLLHSLLISPGPLLQIWPSIRSVWEISKISSFLIDSQGKFQVLGSVVRVSWHLCARNESARSWLRYESCYHKRCTSAQISDSFQSSSASCEGI